MRRTWPRALRMMSVAVVVPGIAASWTVAQPWAELGKKAVFSVRSGAIVAKPVASVSEAKNPTSLLAAHSQLDYQRWRVELSFHPRRWSRWR